ncbi:MAG: hypothetical protein EOM91_11415 [Sphingobacteriia bacterium]|nr:hypothetical protein [Sphingobacteriia bacterium]NCC38206.1 hypothetical protein [Gammaproteobacteria bacterium]
MLKHEIKTCPRCGRAFTCKANRVERCDCLAVALTSTALDHLSTHYQDCLCVDCLESINRAHGQPKPQ